MVHGKMTGSNSNYAIKDMELDSIYGRLQKRDISQANRERVVYNAASELPNYAQAQDSRVARIENQ